MATTDERGNIISRENVTPYGDSLGKRDASNSVAVGSSEHGSGYTGHVRDRDLGLTYMQARYYDPTIGRFMGADPVGFLDNGDPAYFNRYAYANNNPYKNVDPDGRVPVGLTWGFDASLLGGVFQGSGNFAIDFNTGEVGLWTSREFGVKVPDLPAAGGFLNVLVSDEDIRMEELTNGVSLVINGEINPPGPAGVNVARNIPIDRLREGNLLSSGVTEFGVSYGSPEFNYINGGLSRQDSFGGSVNLSDLLRSVNDTVSGWFSSDNSNSSYETDYNDGWSE